MKTSTWRWKSQKARRGEAKPLASKILGAAAAVAFRKYCIMGFNFKVRRADAPRWVRTR